MYNIVVSVRVSFIAMLLVLPSVYLVTQNFCSRTLQKVKKPSNLRNKQCNLKQRNIVVCQVA